MWLVVEQRLFAKERAWAENGDGLGLSFLGARTHHFNFTLFEDIEVQPWFACLENQIAGFVMRMGHTISWPAAQMGKIAWEKDQHRPIESHLKAARPTRQLKEINSAPEEPG